MKRDFQLPSAPAQQAERREDAPVRLSEFPDVLTVTQLCAVLQISQRQFYRLRQHGQFPIPTLPRLGGLRFSRAAVERFLRRSA